jgi:adenylate cyclase
MSQEQNSGALWRAALLGELPRMRRYRSVLKLLPSPPRCKMCNAPFAGAGAPLMRLLGRRPSRRNPHFCDFCSKFSSSHPGGAEIELTLLFADVRGSTALGGGRGRGSVEGITAPQAASFAQGRCS